MLVPEHIRKFFRLDLLVKCKCLTASDKWSPCLHISSILIMNCENVTSHGSYINSYNNYNNYIIDISVCFKIYLCNIVTRKRDIIRLCMMLHDEHWFTTLLDKLHSLLLIMICNFMGEKGCLKLCWWNNVRKFNIEWWR